MLETSCQSHQTVPDTNQQSRLLASLVVQLHFHLEKV